MNKTNGITLIQVVLAVILIIILTSFAIWYASNTSTEARLAKIYSEITAVKEGYQNAKVLNEINEKAYPLSELFEETSISELTNNYSGDDVKFIEDDEIPSTDILYLVNKSNAKKLEIEKIDLEYVIDGTTGRIYLIGGFSRPSSETVAYEYDQIERMYMSTFK